LTLNSTNVCEKEGRSGVQSGLAHARVFGLF
jgi:hypothetical protein